MEKSVVRRKSLITEYGMYHLLYELLESHSENEEDEEGESSFFGIRISQFRENGTLFDQDEVLGITDDRREADRLFYQYVKELVMPVHLIELIDDWNCALQSV